MRTFYGNEWKSLSFSSAKAMQRQKVSEKAVVVTKAGSWEEPETIAEEFFKMLLGNPQTEVQPLLAMVDFVRVHCTNFKRMVDLKLGRWATKVADADFLPAPVRSAVASIVEEWKKEATRQSARRRATLTANPPGDVRP